MIADIWNNLTEEQKELYHMKYASALYGTKQICRDYIQSAEDNAYVKVLTELFGKENLEKDNAYIDLTK